MRAAHDPATPPVAEAASAPTADADAPDAALLAAYAGGQHTAFDTLYDRHNGALWRYVFRSAGDRAVTDDVVQDVWLRVMQNAANWQPRARFRTWLFTLAHHRLVDHWRAQRPQISLDADPSDADDAHSAPLRERLAADSGFGPPRQLETRQQAQALLAALDALPPLQRETFLLQAEGGLSVQAIADATGVSAETAKSRLRYARARLRSALEALA